MRSLMTAITYIAYVWLLISGSMEAFASPFPVMIQEKTVSHYLLMDTPTNRKITHSLVIDDQLLLIGTGEGLFLRDTQKRWKKVLPYAIHEYLFASDGVYFAQIDKSARSSAQSQLFWYRSDDGVTWTEFLKPTLHQIIAYDSKRKRTYKATQYLRYQQSLTSQDSLGQVTFYEDTPLLQNITTLKAHSSSGQLLVGTVAGLRVIDSLGVVTDINDRLGLNPQSDHRFRLFANDHIIVAEVNGNRIFISADNGTYWREITQLKPLRANRGEFRFNRIHTLDRHRLVVSQNKRYFVIDLLSDEFTECILPRYYDYQGVALMGNELIASGHPPKGNNAVVRMGDRTDQKIHTPLFRMRLDEDDYCDKTHSPSHKPIKLVPNFSYYTGFVVDNDSVYAHNKRDILLLPSDRNVLSKPIVGKNFASGTKGTLYIGSARIAKASGEGYEHYPLVRSINKGKDWKEVATNITIPKGAIYDDSLDVAYSHTSNAILRYDLQNGGLDQSLSYDVEFKGSIQKLHVDNVSRLWIQTSKQLYVSVEEGVSTIPLPFKDDPEIDLKGFAKLKDRIVVNYKDQLYLSKTDTIHWKPYRFNPCDNPKTLPIRIVGHSETLIAVQELRYGHIWIINPLTADASQRLYFPRKNGQIKRVAFMSNAVLVETTGIPFTPLKKGHRFTKPAPLLMYNLSLKNVRNHE